MLKQIPSPGTTLVRHRGDSLAFQLVVPSEVTGAAWLRTNLGRVDARHREILDHAERGVAILARDWHDVPMRHVGAGHWRVRLPLTEVGCFRAKAFFEEKESRAATWPDGDDVVIKVDPSEAVLGNTIYTVFPRQFGPNATLQTSELPDAEAIARLDRQGCNVIPPSGTFRQVVDKLDFIMGDLGFRIIQLLPVHPVPTTYARMGRYGSPFAATDFFSVDPALAEFDKRTTPVDQFRELADAVHARRGRVFIDLPANHTGWASRFQTHHPEWFSRTPQGEFESPGAWEVVWADLCKLDYTRLDLWREMAEVFLFWCRQGVDGFRCDAGYMVPLDAWTYITAKVRNEFPECLLLLEGLGGPLRVMESLLTDGNLNWAYSELFQNYTQAEIADYLPGSIHHCRRTGTLVHFAETHDNDRLAANSPAYARLRTALCALFSHAGAFGITNGVEWYAAEKIDVHGASALNWGGQNNQVEHLNRLVAILEAHPGFASASETMLVQTSSDETLALLRRGNGDDETLLALVNLRLDTTAVVRWPASDFPLPAGGAWIDLIGGGRIQPLRQSPDSFTCELEPGSVLCLAPDERFLAAIDQNQTIPAMDRERALPQRYQAVTLDIWQALNGFGDLGAFDVTGAARNLRSDGVVKFCQTLMTAPGPTPIVSWEYPHDLRRTVMIPPGQMLQIVADNHFLAELDADGPVLQRAFSLPTPDGRHFVLLRPLPLPKAARRLSLRLSLYGAAKIEKASAPLLSLPLGEQAKPRSRVGADDLRDTGLYALQTNDLGGFAQVRAAWGRMESQYDAFLAANCHPDYPVDRQIMLRRLRAWVVYRDFSQPLSVDCQEAFEVAPDGGSAWHFDVPVGQGKTIGLVGRLRMARSGNRVAFTCERLAANGRRHCLADENSIKLIIRPDVEDRSGHETTRAMDGPERSFPRAVIGGARGFSFAPTGERRLDLQATTGHFVDEPEWQYMVAQPFEATRGLAPHTDLFSPGYFACELRGGETLTLDAVVDCQPAATSTQKTNHEWAKSEPDASPLVLATLQRAIGQFIVKRDRFKTIVAGYPWFLDWGRDTLICLRGVAAAGLVDECRDILLQFARFEKRGTLPNMIRGDDDNNRDTSDAPLWLFIACDDFMRAAGNADILACDCGGRTVLAAMVSIAENYLSGTPNGIRVDPASGLVFSPSHFTWMDTNHPAGTPREGYPIEIQALWQAALALLSQWSGEKRWAEYAAKARRGIMTFYRRDGQLFLADCLHAAPGTPAEAAHADDHCRPNQLMAATLGAVDDMGLLRNMVDSCATLLVPGGIRSLAARPVTTPLPIQRDGQALNNPRQPYWGRYEGDEDTRRKPAYHNGTAWSWQFPLYPEALHKVYGESARETALALLMSSIEPLNAGCIGQIPEIMDGDTPHTQRGCGAQAWGMTELYRVAKLLAPK